MNKSHLPAALIAYHATTGAPLTRTTTRRIAGLLASGWHPQDAARFLAGH